jgi:hypothetical protein
MVMMTMITIIMATIITKMIEFGINLGFLQ